MGPFVMGLLLVGPYVGTPYAQIYVMTSVISMLLDHNLGSGHTHPFSLFSLIQTALDSRCGRWLVEAAGFGHMPLSFVLSSCLSTWSLSYPSGPV
jgi:hypothetical protein